VIELSEGVRGELIGLTRRPSVAAGLARRARIVLLAAEGVPIRQIGPLVGMSRTVVRDWLDRFRTLGRAGLQDRPRSGRPRTVPP